MFDKYSMHMSTVLDDDDKDSHVKWEPTLPAELTESLDKSVT